MGAARVGVEAAGPGAARGAIPLVGALWAKALLCAASLGLEPALDSWDWRRLENGANLAITLSLAVGLVLWWRRRRAHLKASVLAIWALVLATAALGLWTTWLGDELGLWPFYDLGLASTLDDMAVIAFFGAVGVAVLSVAATAWTGAARGGGRALTLGAGLLTLAAAAAAGADSATIGMGGLWSALAVGSTALMAAGFAVVALATGHMIRVGERDAKIIDAF